jgi:hypothetical protein
VVARARTKGLTSDEHFTVDRTLLEAWAGAKSFQRKDEGTPPSPDDPGNPTVNFHGEKRSNQTHESKTDPDAKLARKSAGTAERDAALIMLEQIPGTKPVTAGEDKGYHTADFVAECRHLEVTPHVAQNDGRRGGSAIDARTTRPAGYAVSQRKRKRIEECFGWLKTIALLRKVRHRGIFKVNWVFTFACAAYHLVRMRNLSRAVVQPG